MATTGGAGKLEYDFVFTDSRRSLYTPAFRNKRLELFEAFDFGNINQPIGQRNTSTVAPQALYLMNHDFVITQSREAAAQRLLRDTALKDDTARLAHAYQLRPWPSPHRSATTSGSGLRGRL